MNINPAKVTSMYSGSVDFKDGDQIEVHIQAGEEGPDCKIKLRIVELTDCEIEMNGSWEEKDEVHGFEGTLEKAKDV